MTRPHNHPSGRHLLNEAEVKWDVIFPSQVVLLASDRIIVKDNRRLFFVLNYNNINAPCTLKKSNSCSTIFLDDSTISQPHFKNTIICISLAIYYHIANRKNRMHERLMEIFEERLHPISVCASWILFTCLQKLYWQWFLWVTTSTYNIFGKWGDPFFI